MEQKENPALYSGTKQGNNFMLEAWPQRTWSWSDQTTLNTGLGQKCLQQRAIFFFTSAYRTFLVSELDSTCGHCKFLDSTSEDSGKRQSRVSETSVMLPLWLIIIVAHRFSPWGAESKSEGEQGDSWNFPYPWVPGKHVRVRVILLESQLCQEVPTQLKW